MSVNASSNLTTKKEMLKMFGPITLFSIILPFIDIITDLRMIIRLAFIGIDSCMYYSSFWIKYYIRRVW